MTLRTIQRGALTDRVRRFFGVAGAYSGLVDEVMSPVAIVADLHEQPWDTNSQRWVARINVSFIGTEAGWLWGVFNPLGLLVVIDRLHLSSTKTINFDVGAFPVPAPAKGNAILSRDLITANAGGFETGVNLAPAPVGLNDYSSTTAGANRATTLFQTPGGVNIVLPVGTVIGKNMVAQLRLPAAPAAADTVVASIWGRIILDSSLDVAP